MKRVVTILVLVALSMVVFSSTAIASSYEYIIDSENLFDDSSEMITMAKEIRSKLNFDVHIYSLSSISDADEIIEANKQNASALLIFIDKNQEMSWWSGSGVKHIIRDVDFEVLFSSIQFSTMQYTEPVNYVLQNILRAFVYRPTSAPRTSPTKAPTTSAESDDVVDNIFNRLINYIRSHPIPILIFIVVLVAYVLYQRYHSDKD